MTFLVWCLSYDDTEDDACTVESSPAPWNDRAYNRRRIGVWTLRDAAHAVEEYARFVHSHRDGWESTWPLVFRVKHEDGKVEDYDVHREAVPEFFASRPRAAGKAAGQT